MAIDTAVVRRSGGNNLLEGVDIGVGGVDNGVGGSGQ